MQREEQNRADDGSKKAAKPADQHHEQHEHRPVDPKGSTRLIRDRRGQPKRARQCAADRRDQEDDAFDPHRADTHGTSGLFVIANGLAFATEPAAQQPVADTQHHDDGNDRHQVNRGAAQIRIYCVQRNQRPAGFTLYQRIEHDDGADRFGQDPHGNREFSGLEAQDEPRQRPCDKQNHESPRDKRPECRHTAFDQPQYKIAAQPDKGLLTNGNQSCVSRQQVPRHCQNDVDHEQCHLVDDQSRPEQRQHEKTHRKRCASPDQSHVCARDARKLIFARHVCSPALAIRGRLMAAIFAATDARQPP